MDYRAILNRIDGEPARRLAHDLESWHGRMEAHRHAIAALGFDPDGHPTWEDCPHAEARQLWDRAVLTLGSGAQEFEFLFASSRGASPARTV